MAYYLSRLLKLKRLWLLVGDVAALCAVAACGGGGGGGGVSHPRTLTDEEQETARVEAELSQEDLDVPEEIVPNTFQGKRLCEVEFELQGESYGGFAAPKLHMQLLPSGEVSEGYLQKGEEMVQIATAAWQGQSAGDGSKAVRLLYISGETKDGRELELYMSDIRITAKEVNGQCTTYTGQVTGGQCSLGGRLWLSFIASGTECKMIYYVLGING